MSEDIKKPNEELEPKNDELPLEALQNVSGGTAAEKKASVHDMSFTHPVDKSSPVLL